MSDSVVNTSFAASVRGNISLVDHKAYLQVKLQGILRNHLDGVCNEGVDMFIHEISRINESYKCQLRQPVGMSEDMVCTLQEYDMSLLFRFLGYLVMNRRHDAFRYRDSLSAVLDAVKVVFSNIIVSFQSIEIAEEESDLFFRSFFSLDVFTVMKNSCQLVAKAKDLNLCSDTASQVQTSREVVGAEKMDNIDCFEVVAHDKKKIKMYKNNVTYYFKYVHRIFQLYNITAQQLPQEYQSLIHNFLKGLINDHELYGLGTKFYAQLYVVKVGGVGDTNNAFHSIPDMSDFNYDLFNDIISILLKHGQEQCLVNLFEYTHALYANSDVYKELVESYIKYFVSIENICSYNLAYHLCVSFGKNHRMHSTYYAHIWQLQSTFRFLNMINKGKWRLALEELKNCSDVSIWIGVYKHLRSLGMYEAAVTIYNSGGLQHVAAMYNIAETAVEEIELELRVNMSKYLSIPLNLRNSIVVINSKDKLVEAQQILGYNAATNLFCQKPLVIGVDCEWPAHMYQQQVDSSVSLLQIAAENYILLFDLMVLSELPADSVSIVIALIQHLFTNSDIIKLGFKMDGGEKRLLRNSYNKIFGTAFDIIEPYQDIEAICKNLIRSQECTQTKVGDVITEYKLRKSHIFEKKSSNELSLSDCCYIFLGQKLNKNHRLSNWAERPLNNDQIMYAALDAYALVSIYNLVQAIK